MRRAFTQPWLASKCPETGWGKSDGFCLGTTARALATMGAATGNAMEPRIINATISPMPAEAWDSLPVITATFDDGTVKELFSYFPDEISFLRSEFIGLT